VPEDVFARGHELLSVFLAESSDMVLDVCSGLSESSASADSISMEVVILVAAQEGLSRVSCDEYRRLRSLAAQWLPEGDSASSLQLSSGER